MSSKHGTRVNNDIKVSKVRLIDESGEQVGVVSTEDALRQARGSKLDLVEVSPNVEPPVCRIMDYGRYQFDQAKKKKEQNKKTRQAQLKEIKFRPVTDIGDYKIKIKKIISFLENGDKVKVTVRFRGREMQHRQLGDQLIQRVIADTEACGDVDQKTLMEGRQAVMILSPKKKK